jgi:hypothetical protein
MDFLITKKIVTKLLTNILYSKIGTGVQKKSDFTYKNRTKLIF